MVTECLLSHTYILKVHFTFNLKLKVLSVIFKGCKDGRKEPLCSSILSGKV